MWVSGTMQSGYNEDVNSFWLVVRAAALYFNYFYDLYMHSADTSMEK